MVNGDGTASATLFGRLFGYVVCWDCRGENNGPSKRWGNGTAMYFAGGRGPYGMAPELFVLAGVFVIVFRSGNGSLYGGG